MPCYHPLDAWQSPSGGSPVFSFRIRYNKIQLPCGQCIGCRLERSRQWAMRCVHEASLHDRNCFITLTYNEEFLPSDNSLKPEQWVSFMKRLRKRFGSDIRFFMCGEYGEQLSRPHYHACLFNFDFDDRVLFSERDGARIYTSEILKSLWTHVDPGSKRDTGLSLGFSTVGDVTFESAAYVARYITKKVTGDLAHTHYEACDSATGEIVNLQPEFIRMSRRPGIAANWHSRYKSDLDKDFLVMRGRKMRPAKFYDKLSDNPLPVLAPAGPFGQLISLTDFKSLEARYELKLKRISNAQIHAHDNWPDRLAVKERIKLSRSTLLKRGIEQ